MAGLKVIAGRAGTGKTRKLLQVAEKYYKQKEVTILHHGLTDSVFFDALRDAVYGSKFSTIGVESMGEAIPKVIEQPEGSVVLIDDIPITGRLAHNYQDYMSNLLNLLNQISHLYDLDIYVTMQTNAQDIEGLRVLSVKS